MKLQHLSALLLVRSLIHLAVVVTVGVWAVLSFPLPLPGVLWAVGACLALVLVWALFLSPRPALKTDRFAQGFFELLFLAAGVAALYVLDVSWIIAVAFGLAGMVVGYLVLVLQDRA